MTRDAPGDAARSLVGEVVDEKYRVDALLGSGGMGAVYRATHLGTGRAVALKVLLAELTANEAAVERFRREARAAGRLRHANVVDVTDFGFAERGGERFAYLVMELLTGQTLRALLEAERRLPLDVAIDLLDPICAAISEAHALGILHRDLKPENIHVAPAGLGWRVKVLDFGIAKLLTADPPTNGELVAAPVSAPVSELATTEPGALQGSGDAAITRRGTLVGTPRYMAPEQWRGEETDARTDVYALGVIAYEMLAGEAPFVGRDGWIAREDTERAPPPLLEKAPSVPRRIARVVEGALARDPAARPPSAAAFAAALHAGRETTGRLLRRSIALVADHYLLLLRRCAVGTVPPVAVAVVGLVAELLTRAGLLTAGVAAIIGTCAIAGALVLGLPLLALVGGIIVPLVDDLAASRAPGPPPPHREMWRVMRACIPSTIVMTSLIAVVTAVVKSPFLIASQFGAPDLSDSVIATAFVVPAVSSASASFAVFAPVVAMERATGLAPLRRSAALLRPMWRAAFGVQLLYGLVTLALPPLVLLALGSVASALSASEASHVRFVLAWISSGLLVPFVVVPPGLLYLRARQAEGRPLNANR